MLLKLQPLTSSTRKLHGSSQLHLLQIWGMSRPRKRSRKYSKYRAHRTLPNGEYQVMPSEGSKSRILGIMHKQSVLTKKKQRTMMQNNRMRTKRKPKNSIGSRKMRNGMIRRKRRWTVEAENALKKAYRKHRRLSETMMSYKIWKEIERDNEFSHYWLNRSTNALRDKGRALMGLTKKKY